MNYPVCAVSNTHSQNNAETGKQVVSSESLKLTKAVLDEETLCGRVYPKQWVLVVCAARQLHVS